MNLTPEQEQRLNSHLEAIAEILYGQTPKDELKSFEGIEKSLRGHLLAHVGPAIAKFFFSKATGIKTGRPRQVTTIVGKVTITNKQAESLQLMSHSRLSPVMTKNALLICANESYQKAEEDLEALTGIQVSHSTLQRLVGRQEFELPDSKIGVKEITIDGGKVRLRGEQKGAGSFWKDYKAVCFNGVYCGAFFQENQTLLDWSNSQKLLSPFWGIGDGHIGIWNLFKEIGEPQQRIEVLDWYHLKENLYKLGGSLRRRTRAEKLLWQGKVDETLELFRASSKRSARNFCTYLETHQERIVNYQYYQEEQVASIGSGTIESVIKQIGRRVKISGAQWKMENVPKILSLRCAYLNGLLAA